MSDAGMERQVGNREELSELGKKILSAVCADLFVSMHFMGPALGDLGYVMDLSTKTVGRMESGSGLIRTI